MRATAPRAVQTAALPAVTYGLISANVLMFLVTAVQSEDFSNNSRGSSIFADLVLIPGYVASGEWWRILGSGFLHYGPLHLFVNMLVLWLIGRELEIVFGSLRYSAIYLVSMIGGAAAVLLFQSGGATAGASGAIYGLFGSQVVVMLQLRRSPGPLLWIIGINLAISIAVPGISLWGHLGGLVAGAAATLAMVLIPTLFEQSKDAKSLRRSRRIGLVAVALVGFALALVIAAWAATAGV